MKIYTKKGDQGQTSLIGGKRVPKYDLRIESYGTVDELNSYLGVLRDQPINEKYKSVLIDIQQILFTIGSHLAVGKEGTSMKLPQLKLSYVEALEKYIDEMDEVLPPMRFFVLPGGHQSVSFCHVARCVCRRAERLVVHLASEEKVDALILQYLNRLSDYLFTLSRKLAYDFQVEEQPWIPEK
jgi:cob(I)alamin adenosyltransferase